MKIETNSERDHARYRNSGSTLRTVITVVLMIILMQIMPVDDVRD